MKDCDSFAKKEIFLQLKNKNRKIFEESNRLTGKYRRLYEETRKTVFFETLFYWEQYIASSGKTDITDFRVFLDFSNLLYKYFFQENLKFPPNYKDFQLVNINTYSAEINLIKRNLERSIESVMDDNYLKSREFEYNNILGDLYLNMFLILKDFNDYNIDSLKETFKKSIDYYQKSGEYKDSKGNSFISVNFLPVFTNLLKELNIINNLEVINKLIKLKKYYKEFLT